MMQRELMLNVSQMLVMNDLELKNNY